MTKPRRTTPEDEQRAAQILAALRERYPDPEKPPVPDEGTTPPPSSA